MRNFIKTLAFRALGLAFLLCRVFPVQKNKAVLLSHFPDWCSLAPLGDALEADGRFTVRRIPRWNRPGTLYHLATAKAIFLNNNLNLLPYLRFSPQTACIQLWHGNGALKRWGFSLPENQTLRPIHYDAAICASEPLRSYWAEAFRLPMERVLPLGSPRIDALRQPCDTAALRADFDRRYPSCRGKRLILFAPTFRDDPAKNAALLAHFDFAAFQRRFGETTALLLRMHPARYDAAALKDLPAVDVTPEPNAADLLRICERVITDYSSICVEAAALDLPILIFNADYDDFMADRGFYKSFAALPPGPMLTDFETLLEHLARPDDSQAQRAAFTAFHLGEPDGRSCERIIKIAFDCA